MWGSIKNIGVRSKKCVVRDMMSEPHMQNQGVGSVYFVWFGKGSLPFFLERGSMTNFAKPSAFSRFLKSFAGTLDFFSGPAAFCGVEQNGGGFAKNSRGLQANRLQRSRKLQKVVQNRQGPLSKQKNGSDPLRTTHLYRTQRLYREIRFSYVLKNTSLNLI